VIVRDGLTLGWLTVAEAAQYVGVSAREFRRLVASEGIPYVKTGSQRRFRVHDLEAWADTRVCQSSTASQGGRSISAASPLAAVASLSPQASEIRAELERRLSGSTTRRRRQREFPPQSNDEPDDKTR
jgi:excisionase family DNA binding protein